MNWLWFILIGLVAGIALAIFGAVQLFPKRK
jgi:hypothetical protein